jgi:hypothetical protein
MCGSCCLASIESRLFGSRAAIETVLVHPCDNMQRIVGLSALNKLKKTLLK